VAHLRRACADILPTPLFAFLLRVFQGPDTEPGVACDRFLRRLLKGCRQELTLVHFSAQLEPCLTHKNTLHTLNTP